MIAYRGVDTDKLVESLELGDAFLRSLNLPLTATVLDRWRAGKPYEQILAATSGKELADIMRKQTRGSIFARSQEVLKCEAAVSKQGREVFAGLNSWGGFYADRTGAHPADAEHDRHVVQLSAELLAATTRSGLTDEAERELRSVWTKFSPPGNTDSHYTKFLQGIEQMIERIQAGDRVGAERALSKLGGGGLVMKEALTRASGLAEKTKVLEFDDVFGRYSVIAEQSARQAAPPLDQVRRALEPFAATDEVLVDAHAWPVENDRQRLDVIFVATKEAAQAVVDQVPECAVIDINRNQRLGRSMRGIEAQHQQPTAAPVARRPQPQGHATLFANRHVVA